MFITAMYIYGISQGSWQLSYIYVIISFFLDLVLARMFSPVVSIKPKNELSMEERYYYKKLTEVAELERTKLDRELYGSGKK